MIQLVGVDLGATNVRCGVVSAGHILSTSSESLDATTADELVGSIEAEVRRLCPDVAPAAVGVAVATYVDTGRSTAMFSPNLPFRRFPLRAALEESLGVPVVVENDANAAVWAEVRFGAGRGASDVLGLTLGSGVGGAVVIGGELRRGVNGFGGELGHLRVVPDGHLCGCGLRGCLEQYASGTALARYGRELVAAEGKTAGMLYELAEGDAHRVIGPMVSAAARAGDGRALAIFETLGTWLGVGLGSLVSVLDPELIVIGGGLAAEGELFLDATRRALAESVTGAAYRTLPPIVAAELGADAGWRGAADLAAAQLR
ncbi:MAG TPA: ROK family protein [Nocardioidaceae bacterium]|nr:ROK family protein [Nocardioidaceae bacterium]